MMSMQQLLAERQHLYTGRASTAIYLILKAHGLVGAQVLVPCNICYAAVLPILYSGNIPIFSDVGEDGNLTFVQVAGIDAANLGAVIVPHMYGNTCLDIEAIYRYCAEQGILCIEDCASSMGADIDGRITGSFADYAVFSFGYSKTIDAGYGGLIVSRRSLTSLAILSKELGAHSTEIDAKLKFLSDLYRVIRNTGDNSLIPQIYALIPDQYRECFLFQGTNAHYARIEREIASLDDIIQVRRERIDLYRNALRPGALMHEYHFHPGAVPWRYNLMVEVRHKPALVKHLLAQRVAVSDWYPVVTPMFGMTASFPQARSMETRILNFPLVNIEPAEIVRICTCINEFESENLSTADLLR